MIDKIFSKK